MGTGNLGGKIGESVENRAFLVGGMVKNVELRSVRLNKKEENIPHISGIDPGFWLIIPSFHGFSDRH